MLQSIRRRSPVAEALLHTLCHFVSERDESLFLVGGLVRDVLAGSGDVEGNLLDIDLAIDGDPGPLVPLIAAAAVAQPVTHERFGTVSATLVDGTRIDVALTRSERYPSPGALPSVSPAPIEVDLGRRDFSINAMAMALTGDRAGALLDPFGGMADLERRKIRTLHPESFRDDPTRLMRAARYASRIGATIERRTARDAGRERHHLAALTAERFGDAWRLLLQEPDPASALSVARRLEIPQSREPRWTLPAAALRTSQPGEVFWAGVGLLATDPSISDWLPGSVGMQRTERTSLAAGVWLRGRRRSLGGIRRPSRVADMLSGVSDSALEAAGRLWTGRSGAAVSAYLHGRSEVRSPISPSALMELGIRAGPELGKTITEIEGLIWDGGLDPADRSAVARLKQRIRLSR
ncbi:MAG: hypothetical protein OXG27_10970 [Chloroflexi bacterium]|nr:hypothetical protein [Chloroflexota bacterium]